MTTSHTSFFRRLIMTVPERELRAGDKEVKPAGLDRFRLGGETEEMLNTAGGF